MEQKKFLDQLRGKWISQKTNYFIKDRSIKFSQSAIQLNRINARMNNYDKNGIANCELNGYELYNTDSREKACYLFQQKISKRCGNVRKITRTKTKYCTFEIYAKNCLKIECTSRNLVNEEYIYFVKPEFKIIITTLKKENRYLAVSFISEIQVAN